MFCFYIKRHFQLYRYKNVLATLWVHPVQTGCQVTDTNFVNKSNRIFVGKQKIYFKLFPINILKFRITTYIDKKYIKKKKKIIQKP